MKRLAGRQTEIRQQAERLNLHLRAHGVPSGDLDAAIANMRELERHAIEDAVPKSGVPSMPRWSRCAAHVRR